MSLSVGIVGLPNVGKSTIFNALTSAGAQSENYPFCTIDPNVGIVPVPDKRLARIEEYIDTEEVLPASVEIVDIAGLVEGASKGEGLGNKFLANIRETDAILHVVRCFEDPNVVHVDGSIDPIRDIEVIELELIYADLDTVEKRLKKAEGHAKSGGKDAIEERDLFRALYDHIENGEPARSFERDEDADAMIRGLHLLSDKPVLYCCNVSESDAVGGNEYSEKVEEFATARSSGTVIVSGKIEEELSVLEDEERDEMLEAYGLEEPALNNLIRACYRLLGLQSYFTVGPKEIRAWTVRIGASAPEAAGVIHTDFEKGFIRASVYTLEDLEEYESEAAIKSAGKMRSEGKEYIVQDGDIMHFLFNN
jgi:GTP-binding protein YchF